MSSPTGQATLNVWNWLVAWAMVGARLWSCLHRRLPSNRTAPVCAVFREALHARGRAPECKHIS